MVCVWGLLGLGACASESPGITPARNQFYFPTGLALDPLRPFLYLANSDADLRFNGSTLQVLDLRPLPRDLSQIAEQVKSGALSCSRSPADPTTWECPGEQFVQPEATLRLGDYPSEVRVTSDGKRLFVPVRGQNYLLWADIVDRGGGKLDLRCNDDLQTGCHGADLEDCEAWDCDARHRLTRSDDEKRTLPPEPFGIYVNELVAVHVGKDGALATCKDEVSGVSCACVAGEAECTTGAVVRDCCSAPKAEAHLYLAHLSGGEVSFLTSDAKGVQLKDSRGGFFNDKSGIRGGFALAPQLPGASQGLVYVSSRVNSVLASFLVDGESRIIDATRAPVGVLSPGDDVRGIAFGPGGRRLYVVDRAPAALVALDMTPGDDGLPRQEGLWAAEVCADPAMLRLGPDPTRPEEPLARLAYVVCFSAAQVFVVDTGLGKVVDQFLTGRGPNALVIDSPNRRGFLANFLDNTVGVIDLDPSHVTYNRMVLRLGREENLVHH